MVELTPQARSLKRPRLAVERQYRSLITSRSLKPLQHQEQQDD